ncbi:MAG: adenosine deaminase [Pseudomonadota bacterium]|jgi:adenosine deaminase
MTNPPTTPPTAAAAPNILLCTLGASWAVIPEVLGWLAPDVVDLYAHHPQRAALDALRAQHQLQRPTELWVCTTQGHQTQDSLQQLHQWWFLLRLPMPLRIWAAQGTDQLATQAECAHIRELTLRVALLAAERCAGGGQLVLSLAGGRKTMSADLQTAAGLFGAAACLHVVGPDPLPAELLGRTPSDKARLPLLLAQPLPAHLATAIMPLVASTGQRNELLDMALDGQTVNSTRFPVPLPAPHGTCAWPAPAHSDSLHQEISRRQQASSQLLGNFLAQLAQSERHENWRSLYRLPPATIDRLRQTPLGPEHLAWLTALPKADLHRHLGGCLSLAQQRSVAQCIWQQLPPAQQQARLQDLQALLPVNRIADEALSDWPWDWPQTLSQPHDTLPQARAERAAALLLHASAAQLQRNLYGVTEPRLALKHSTHGFAAYERPGELSGSALLSHPAALLPYAQAVVQQAQDEGLSYLELRGSPHKYRPDNPAAWLAEFRAALEAAGAQTGAGSARLGPAGRAVRLGFIWILDRRQREQLPGVVQQAVAAQQGLRGFLLGLDMAGDEGTHNPAQLAPGFLPAFEACLPITIHAGEGEAAHHIWQAAYHLHADRIGHGLSLSQHPELASRFRDRGIALELCPSSNREVVGFADPEHPASQGLAAYPLRQFMQSGLHVVLCTDNPGISRTNLPAEFLVAARMTEGGLSLWEVLALVRQAFVHAFLPSAERESLLKACDERVFGLMAPASASAF